MCTNSKEALNKNGALAIISLPLIWYGFFVYNQKNREISYYHFIGFQAV